MGDYCRESAKRDVGKRFSMGLLCFCTSCQQDTDCVGSKLFLKNVYIVNTIGR